MSRDPELDSCYEQIYKLERELSLLRETEEICKSGCWSENFQTGEVIWSKGEYLLHDVPFGTPPTLALHLQCLHPQDRVSNCRNFEEHLLSNETRFKQEYRIVRRDGVIRHIQVQYHVVRNSSGKAIYVYGSSQDVTDRQDALISLRNSEGLFQALFEQSGGYSMILKPTFSGIPIILDANEAACQAHGLTRDEMLGRPLTDLHDEEGKRLCIERTKIILSGKPLTIETTHVRKDGTVFPVAVRANIVELEGQEPLILTTEFDLTQIKQVEQEKNVLENQLSQAQKLESIGVLAGGIAHDFNNILASIIGFTELALDEAPPGSPLRENLEEVVTAGARARDLVKQIVEFSRQSKQEKLPLSISAVLGEVLKFIRSTIPATITLKTIVTDSAHMIGNSTKIYQVFLNILTNAAQALDETGGIIEVSLKNIKLDNETGYGQIGLFPGPYTEIKIKDNGPGIPASIRNRIFEPYFTTKTLGKGSGMGLAIVYGIVENHKGKVWVNSQEGEGTTFTILLPRILGHSSPDDQEIDTIPMGTERILCVDDEPLITKMTHETLSRLGYKVTSTTSSIEALEMFQAAPDSFDLVISDMSMPGLSGDQLARAMLAIRPEIPIIIITGYSNKMNQTIAWEIGIKAVESKPMAMLDLAILIRDILDQ